MVSEIEFVINKDKNEKIGSDFCLHSLIYSLTGRVYGSILHGQRREQGESAHTLVLTVKTYGSILHGQRGKATHRVVNYSYGTRSFAPGKLSHASGEPPAWPSFAFWLLKRCHFIRRTQHAKQLCSGNLNNQHELRYCRWTTGQH
jgi:hypothetical protein